MSPSKAATPVHIVTGFLGAGKTTLLGHALRTQAFHRTALIVNEVGPIGLDDELLRSAVDIPPVLLERGCLCCALGRSLAHTLRELQVRRARAQIPQFARVVVETSGLADPRPIVEDLVADPWLARHYEFSNVISLFDACRGLDTLAAHPESVAQLGTADIVVLSKMDLLPAERRAPLLATIEGINGHALVLEAERGRVPPECLLGRNRSARTTTEVHSRMLDAAGEMQAGLMRDNTPHPTTSAHLVIEYQIPWTRWAAALDRIAAGARACLLRVKGLIAVADLDRPVMIHAVGSTFFEPELLASWPSVDRRSRVVLICRGDGAPRLIERLESLLMGPAGRQH